MKYFLCIGFFFINNVFCSISEQKKIRIEKSDRLDAYIYCYEVNFSQRAFHNGYIPAHTIDKNDTQKVINISNITETEIMKIIIMQYHFDESKIRILTREIPLGYLRVIGNKYEFCRYVLPSDIYSSVANRYVEFYHHDSNVKILKVSLTS